MDDPLHFTFIQPHLRFGGAENQTVLVVNMLVEQGCEVTLLLHKREGALIEKVDQRVRVLDCGGRAHALLPLIALRIARRLRSMQRSFIVVKLWSSVMSVGLAQWFLGRGTPHAFAYCENLDAENHIKFSRLGRVKRWMVRQVFRKQSLLIANSEAVAATMTRVYGLSSKPEVIYPSINPSLMTSHGDLENDSVHLPSGERPLHIGSVGRITLLKGYDVTLRAIAESGLNVKWTIVGDGEARADLEADAKRCGRLKLALLGSRSRPFDSLVGVDVFVHSALSEAFGTVVLEALAVGVPVIASGTKGSFEIAQVVGDDRWVRTYPTEDSASLANALRAFLPRQAPDREALQHKLEAFSLTRQVDQWKALASAARKSA